jgi:hypothetical protein
MKTVYVVTMWSGGRPAKKWKSEVIPEPLSQGTGVSFISTGTRLRVTVIGNISVEEYESGKEELEMGLNQNGAGDEGVPPLGKPGNIERIF